MSSLRAASALSSDLIEACTERGIEIAFLSFNGKPYAKLNSPSLTATVISRREQLAAYHDERGVEIAKRFAAGKLRNQINLVRYFGKYRKKSAPKKYDELVERATARLRRLMGDIQAFSKCRVLRRTGSRRLMSSEPRCSTLRAAPERSTGSASNGCCPPVDSRRENIRVRSDDVNALLNYGYGMLYSQVWSALALAGLEPFAGFLHVDRPGKPSLVLDFIEEFRQPIVDRVVFAMINKKFRVEWEEPDDDAAKSAHQSAKPDADPDAGTQRYLSKGTRRALADRILERLQETERFERKDQKLCNIIQIQARHLAMFLRGERDYQPLVASW